MRVFITPIVYLLAFLTVVLSVQSAASLVFSARDRAQRVNRRLTMLEAGMTSQEVYSVLVQRASRFRSGVAWIDDLHASLFVYASQAGPGVTPLRLLGAWGGLAAVLWLGSLAFLRTGPAAGFVGNAVASLIGSGLVSALAVWLWVSGQRRKRLKKLEDQLPLALDIVTRAIRAGHPVIASVQLAANELGDPIGTEFGLIVDETTYGAEFKEALRNFARRTGSPDAHFFAVSVAIQAETGGNLAEILHGLATVIRGRSTLAARVKALASEGRMSAKILSALPAFVVGFFLLIQPHFYTDKFADPVFWPIVSGVLVLYGAGWLMIHRIINFKY